jgi:predicted enzyme related to lactoylglutathione lyase
MTTDAKRSLGFYTALFGWTIEARPMGDFTYHAIHAGPGTIGGILEEAAIPCYWMPYVAVDDVDASAERCKQLGGSVCVPPTDIPATGRFSIVGDPAGAYLSLYRGNAESSGADPDRPVPGRVCWNELLCQDEEAAERFYAGLFGWGSEPKDLGQMGTYRVQTLGGKQAAGLMKNPGNGAPDTWLAYFLVEDLAASTNRAKELGATAIMESAPIPGLGSFSLVRDPLGAVLALFQPSAEAC